MSADRTEPAGTPGAEAGAVEAAAMNARQIRGSSLLLVGRVLGLAIDFIAQVVLVRYLTKDDYGAFALALSLVAIGTTISLLGLERTLGRFAPIYEEQGDHGLVWGTILTIFATVASLGLVVILVVHAFAGAIGVVVADELALAVVLILIAMAPLQALDSLLVAMFATFGSPRSIFVRRYVVAPLLQLGVAVAVALSGAGVRELALGYVVVTALGIAVYLVVLVRLLRERGLLAGLRRATLRLPIRAIFGFSLPLLTSDLVFVLRGSITILLLGMFAGTAPVADFRAVLPLAVQLLFVATSFRLIFTPGASRLFARDRHVELNELYWQTAAWIAVLTFPVFVTGLALAEPVAVLLFGEPYRASGGILSILVIGYYLNGAVGFNSLTLRVFGRVRYMVAVDLLTAAIGLSLTLVLIARAGAMGAAVGTTLSFVLQNVLYQWGLRTRTTVAAFDRRYVATYASIVVGALVVVALQVVLRPPFAVGLVVAAVVSLAVVGGNRRTLRVLEAYPELARYAPLRRLFGVTTT